MSDLLNRRNDDRSITTLTLAVERLAESQTQISATQSQISLEIKDLAKTISKLDVVMEKLVSIEERHSDTYKLFNTRLSNLEKSQSEGCPALRELRIAYEGRYDKIVGTIGSTNKEIEKLQTIINRVTWTIVATVIASLLNLIISHGG